MEHRISERTEAKTTTIAREIECKLDDRVIETWTPKIHVWGAIGYYLKTDLYFLKKYECKTLSENHI